MIQQEIFDAKVIVEESPIIAEDILRPSAVPNPEVELLRDSEERFRQLAESINEVFWICDARSHQFLYVSPAYEKIWGRSCQSLYDDPESLFDAAVPEDRARLAAALAEQTLLPQAEIEYRILSPTNVMRWIRTRTFPVRMRGTVNRVVGVSQDITDRKVAEKAILEISARERRRIGQDLHDSLCQQLTGIAYMNKVLEQKLGDLGVKEASEAAYIGQLLQEAIQETRTLARGLNPVQVEAHGLMSALQELAASTEKLFKMPCVYQCEGSIKIHDHDAATHLYRVAQEALSNAIKHAKATHVVIGLIDVEGTVTLRVRDDGKGFPDEIPSDAGMGLHIMHYRARMIGATLTIKRDGNEGTLVTCTYPNNPWR